MSNPEQPGPQTEPGAPEPVEPQPGRQPGQPATEPDDEERRRRMGGE